MTTPGLKKRNRAEDVYSNAYSDGAGHPDHKIIAGKSANGLKILSLGSGDGSDLWFLSVNNEVYALDSSSSAVAVARAHGLNAQLADLEQSLPFDDSTFDIVVAKDLMEHLVAPEQLMAEVWRVLKADGRLVLSIPNHFYLPFRFRILFGANLIWRSLIHDHSRYFDEWNYMHLRFFTWRGLQRFLAASEFRIEQAFWDFGSLAHYTNPDMFYEHLKEKYASAPLSRKARLFFYGFFPAWQVFNFIFPKKIRSFLVGLAPGVFCAGFYLHCKKLDRR